MYVLTTLSGTLSAGPSYTAGSILQIPAVLYDPITMTRLGTALTPDQAAALIPWTGFPAVTE